MDALRTFRYWVRDDDLEDIFDVELSQDITITELARIIKDRDVRFHNMNANRLELYSTSASIDHIERLESELDRWDPSGKKKLSRLTKLSRLNEKCVIVVNAPTSGEVKFWILLNDNLVDVSVQLGDDLVKLFRGLRKDEEATKYLPKKVSASDCEFYQLNRPVQVVKDLGQVKQTCLEESNRISVSPIATKIRELARRFFSDHVYLVIDLPEPREEEIKAIGKLKKDHTTLFECLQVTVEVPKKWYLADVEVNLRGGIFTNNVDDLPPEFGEIQDSLAQPRVYQADDTHKSDFQHARSYQTQFDRVFAPSENDTHTVINDREFAAFHSVLRCFDEDVSAIAKEEVSSALKASNFTVHFVQPPFFSKNDASRGFQYHQEKSWGFPLFVGTASTPDSWLKYIPRSDWMVISPEYKIPFVVSEVISQKRQQDRSRMLVQAAVLARVGRYLLKPSSKAKFFVVAIYVDAEMTVSRYLVLQTGCGNTGNENDIYKGNAVCIHQKDFSLTDREQQVDFLREMYNLATQISALSGELDDKKKGDLAAVLDAAAQIPSLTSTKHETKTSGSTRMDSIAEEDEERDEPQDEDVQDDLGVFEAKDIQNILYQMNYKIVFIPSGFPQLAVIVSKTSNAHGYLKFVEREREVKVLQYLTKLESPSNHTISGVQFWPVQGGTVISMPVAGGWLTSLKNPDSQLWGVGLQLFEAVAFMHEHNVAHMDLKPQNVIIPPEGGRLSIIDFSVSIRVRGPDARHTGVVGTEGYMAPEVHSGHYKPMLADLWSCGKTLEKLCSRCGPSTDRTALLAVAGWLMNPDPEARPKMSTVLDWMASARRDGNIVPLALPFSPTISPLCA